MGITFHEIFKIKHQKCKISNFKSNTYALNIINYTKFLSLLYSEHHPI